MAKKMVDLSAFGFGQVELDEELIALAIINGAIADVEVVPESPPPEEYEEDLPEYLRDDPCYAPGYEEREMVADGLWRVNGDHYEAIPLLIQTLFSKLRQLEQRLEHNPPTHLSVQMGMVAETVGFLAATTPEILNKELGLLSAELLIVEELTHTPNMPRQTLAELKTNWFGA